MLAKHFHEVVRFKFREALANAVIFVDVIEEFAPYIHNLNGSESFKASGFNSLALFASHQDVARF